MNIREKILNSNDIKKELVYVSEWDVTLEVRTMNGKQRSDMLKNAVDKNGVVDFEKMYPTIIIGTVYDPETGLKVFEASDREILNTKSAKCVEDLAKTALKLSGLDKESMDTIEKN